ncbi:CbiD protein [Prochlorococcus marinus str. MIT 9515]|uniref:Cobalt-precorrin-5B C(1)-methyltransferase n=1 Tax=Prochlorococcus marinus (strain MIT 9515) TaxID=167542 RepID=CBID_PROM5|nr:cobalt-precorrin-5B (C(1))-methyltransferase CbiD [Prochlorococcus marinus]A2BTY3.1 RecName: Full=Cobalt-precorrin-5B C(1)-methyltransferase; AltName: Full=Cobalt-precorrin-6A synthase [Prochlorococcus marinus str. MIT 9515]ABM71244.1 CbiD protein [Prochlorococcus marinus str. MIT 9515]
MKKGFSLPLWVTGAAKSAVKKLTGLPFEDYELIKIPNDKNLIKIKVHSAGLIKDESHALGISFADSGLDLDVTQNLEIWTIAFLEKTYEKDNNSLDLINIIPGYGVGIDQKTSEICISKFAKEVLFENLLEILPAGYKLNLEIIFPNGKFLAERTSNQSFGIVQGLSIIGTSAETFSSASPDQLKNAKAQLEKIVSHDFYETIIFVIGENGLHLAKSSNIKFPIIKVGNWIGPLLVDAALKKIKRVILFGYHGKLIKLAGGIFHTHNHLADARIEILVYLAVKEEVPIEMIKKLSLASNVEDALLLLESSSPSLADKLWNKLSDTVEKRSSEYLKRYITTDMKVAAIIFDRQRKIRWSGDNGKDYISSFKGF